MFQELLNRVPVGLLANESTELNIKAEEAFKLKKIFGGSGIQTMEELQIIEILNSYEYLFNSSHLSILRPVTSTLSTMLHTASWFRRCTVIKWLILHGATIDCITNKGNTPLHFACENANQNGAYDSILVLLTAGADINKQNLEMMSPFDKAKEQNCIDIIEQVQLYMNINNSTLNDLPITAIQGVSSKETKGNLNIKVTQPAVSAPGLFNITSAAPSIQSTPVFKSPFQQNGVTRTVEEKDPRVLMKAEQTFSKLKSMFEKMAQSPFSSARADDEAIYQFMIENISLFDQGILNVNRDYDLKNKTSFLHLACSRGMLLTVMAMLICGFDLTKINVKKNTLAHIESFENSQLCGDIILCLLSFGATVENNTNLDGKTPLEMTNNQTVTTKICNWLNLQKNHSTSFIFSDLKHYLTDPTIGLLTKLLRCHSPIDWSKFSSSNANILVNGSKSEQTTDLDALASQLNINDENQANLRASANDELKMKLLDKTKRKAKPGSTLDAASQLLKEIDSETSNYMKLQNAAKDQAQEALRKNIASKEKQSLALMSTELEYNGKEFDQVFEALDTKNTNSISYDDLVNFHKSFHGCGLVVEQLFMMIPPDYTIRKSNFRQVVLSLHLCCKRLDDLRWDFRVLDYDNCGSVSIEAASSLWDLYRTSISSVKFPDYENFRKQNPSLPKNRILWEELEANLVWSQFSNEFNK